MTSDELIEKFAEIDRKFERSAHSLVRSLEAAAVPHQKDREVSELTIEE